MHRIDRLVPIVGLVNVPDEIAIPPVLALTLPRIGPMIAVALPVIVREDDQLLIDMARDNTNRSIDLLVPVPNRWPGRRVIAIELSKIGTENRMLA